jgi:hypothetical protein
VASQKYSQLEKELAPYKSLMAKATDAILDQEVTKYPILVVHQHNVEIGIPLIPEDQKSIWQIQASSLEEFVSKQIIDKKKIDSFTTIYKNPENHFCLFVLSELGAQFIFLARDNEVSTKRKNQENS